MDKFLDLQKLLPIDLSVFESAFLERCIKKRIKTTGSNNLYDYIEFIENNNIEKEILFNILHNSHSEFFRDSILFSCLENRIIPKLISDFRENRINEIRIWSAGCSEGQEPYSLAILIENIMLQKKIDVKYRIFATDLSEIRLRNAEIAGYNFMSIKNLRFELLKKYFTAKDDLFFLNEIIKDKVYFSRYELLSTETKVPPGSIYGEFDIVLCNNLLMYYNKSVRKKITEKLLCSVKLGGYLIIGEIDETNLDSIQKTSPYLYKAPIFTKNFI